jgi:GTP-binding protein HflX
VAAIVGYTNAGKSTLINTLTGADLFAADKLFATLDPTVRHFHLPNGQRVLACDTVGFLQKLPHHLVESFQATLEEVREADILIHVIDCSHPLCESQMEAVDIVLDRLESRDKQTLMVFNKVDKLEKLDRVQRLSERFEYAATISAITGEGIDILLQALEEMLRAWRLSLSLRIPQDKAGLVAEIYRVGRVLEQRYEDNDIIVKAHIPPLLQGKMKAYIQ